ncbi:MAG: S-adenosylmethionine:tRNA ribosyltransferase-isomerase, partial [Methylophaga sp.]|nr:S-adenosylmethionine:tRNA ribosyltransferase-isomerase [Methylophaga sp.]
MQRTDFQFDLPDELIAQYPAAQRAASRLLTLDGNSGELSDKHFPDLIDLLHADDLLVFNNTKVISARLLGERESGGKVEVLIERLLDNNQVLAYLRCSNKLPPGHGLILENVLHAEVVERRDNLFVLQFLTPTPLLDCLQKYG